VEVPVYNIAGEEVKKIQISDDVFGVAFNEALVHQAMVRQRADRRQGTSDTKTRGEVAGSRKKIFQQKHTGEARAGDKRSPTRRHGGIAFGPHPRSYRKDMPKKMRQLALKCLLSTKALDKDLVVLEEFNLEGPKTKGMVKVLESLKLNSKALIVTAEVEKKVVLSARNIPGIKTMPADIMNVVDLLSYKSLLMTEAAVRKAEQLWGKKQSQEESSAAL
jgi:large subunit ribosomal protein L4